ncbi:MAG: 5-(carboxyamino)imidazole ribonucleotide mutase [Desulfobacteraceae bacterium]|jgi:5-(carboxyamino)imidazole ribonucleotide mutase|nr:5-(carboxyamino)imidazole ribonucleotide mutase [Desulfobacteraceae bacterium]
MYAKIFDVVKGFFIDRINQITDRKVVSMDNPAVGILMGSESDLDKMRTTAVVFEEMDVAYEMKILSANRLPDVTTDCTRSARERGLEVIICGAGMAAHLAGAVAAQTTLPVIGVPLASGALSGVDALYATVQMPSGIPVATVAIDGAANAASGLPGPGSQRQEYSPATRRRPVEESR